MGCTGLKQTGVESAMRHAYIYTHAHIPPASCFLRVRRSFSHAKIISDVATSTRHTAASCEYLLSPTTSRRDESVSVVAAPPALFIRNGDERTRRARGTSVGVAVAVVRGGGGRGGVIVE